MQCQVHGLEQVAGLRGDEVALFHFHNRARAGGAAVLYAADAPPEALGLGLPDLRSRLGQCTRLPLQPLDDEGRRAVLRARANVHRIERVQVSQVTGGMLVD